MADRVADPVTARATLFMKTIDGAVTSEDFLEGASESPWHAARELRDAIADDFPGAIFAIGQNERSTKLMANENMRRLGLEALVEPV